MISLYLPPITKRKLKFKPLVYVFGQYRTRVGFGITILAEYS